METVQIVLECQETSDGCGGAKTRSLIASALDQPGRV